MNFAKRLLMVAGAVALAGVLGALLAPKAAHGIVATFVQVVNTAANPVPVAEQNNPALQSFELTQLCSFTSFNGNGCPGDNNLLAPGPNEVDVVEFVGGSCNLVGGTNLKEVLLNNFGAGSSAQYPILPLTAVGSTFGLNNNEVHFSQTVKVYVDGSAGQTLSYLALADQPQPGGQHCQFSVSGYRATK